jgi:hypothetical protein
LQDLLEKVRRRMHVTDRKRMRVLQATAITTWLLLSTAGVAQTDVQKTQPQRPIGHSEIRKGKASDITEAKAEPNAANPNSWAVEVSDGSVIARSAEITVDGQRTRFSLLLSAPVKPQIFTLADPYRVIIDMPDVSFQLAKGDYLRPGNRGSLSTSRVRCASTLLRPAVLSYRAFIST